MLDSHLSDRGFFLDQRLHNLIKKYVVVLIVLSILRQSSYTALPLLMAYFTVIEFSSWIGSAYTIIPFVMNLVALVFLYADMQQRRSFSASILILTFFTFEAGVLIFLIQEIYNSLSSASADSSR